MQKRALLAAAAAVLLAGLCLVAGCSGAVTVDGASPRVADVEFTATSSLTEASQQISVRVAFDAQISASGDVADDFEVLLNDEPIDEDAIAFSVSASGEAITFTFSPAESASTGPSGGGSYFAVYAGKVTIEAARDDGALAHVAGVSGSCAVLDEPIEGTLPSGLAIEVTERVEGSEASGTLAQTTFEVTSPALVRAITWFSPDGGQTLLLKHNHEFASASAEDCAEDLASLVNDDASLGLVATATGTMVTLTAQQACDGQLIEPVIVEGYGVSGGTYDQSEGTGE